MKKMVFCTAFVIIILGLNQKVHAQGREFGTDAREKLFITMSFGAVASWLTRIIDQNERSNFVYRDFLPGLYYGIELRNVKYITPFTRLTAYYPLISSFNHVPQKPNSPLHFGIDFLTGLRFGFNIRHIVRLHVGPALHLFFLNAERWNYFNLGAAAVAGVEFPISRRWTLLIDGIASFDSGNLGANRKMEPFDTVFHYQTGVGARYSKKMPNVKHLIPKWERKKKDKNENENIIFYR